MHTCSEVHDRYVLPCPYVTFHDGEISSKSYLSLLPPLLWPLLHRFRANLPAGSQTFRQEHLFIFCWLEEPEPYIYNPNRNPIAKNTFSFSGGSRRPEGAGGDTTSSNAWQQPQRRLGRGEPADPPTPSYHRGERHQRNGPAAHRALNL